MTVFVYVRPWSSDQFSDLAKNIWPADERIFVSEHRSVDIAGLSHIFYKEYNALDSKFESIYLNDDELNDVIIKCRLLRAINYEKARRMVCAMEKAIESLFITHNPAAMLSITTDSYIQHLFVLACNRISIPFIGLVPSFVNGYFRITKTGERVFSRSVSVEECEKVLTKLQDNSYKPGFIAGNKFSQQKKIIRLWFRNIPKPIWFFMKRIFTRDPLNYHYLSTQIVASDYWSILPKNYDSLSPMSEQDIITAVDSRPVLFIPLQMSPEATIDYWSENNEWIYYEDKIVSLIDDLSYKYNVVVKEHPNVVGYRTKGFYKKLEGLQRDKKCILVDPFVNSNMILNCTDGVVICTGSVGFEAAIRGIPVYSDARPFHLPNERVLPINNLFTNEIEDKVDLSPEDKRKLVCFLLESVLPGNFINDGSWDAMANLQDEAIYSLRCFINNVSN